MHHRLILLLVGSALPWLSSGGRAGENNSSLGLLAHAY